MTTSALPRSAWLRLAAPLLAVSALVVLTSLVVTVVAYRLQVADPGSAPVPALRWFDVNSERNVPTAWSTLLLLAGAAAAAALAQEGRHSSRPGTGWLLVASTAALLALDEWLELHERLGAAGEAVARDALHFAWVVPGTGLAAAVGVVLLTRLRRQPVAVRRRLVAAGAVYLSGALLAETVSGQVLRAYGGGRAYVAVTGVEEGLEMAGASLLLAALLAQLRHSREARQELPQHRTDRHLRLELAQDADHAEPHPVREQVLSRQVQLQGDAELGVARVVYPRELPAEPVA